MFAPGDCLASRYRIRQQLGEGGFARTFLVEDLRAVNPSITDDESAAETLKVVKILKPKMAERTPKAIELFQREASVLMRLNHPGIPKVAADGYFQWTPEGGCEHHCLAMQYIEGNDLQTWLEEGSHLTEARAIAWLQQIAEVLQKLHDRQVLHRDIKPSNIILKPDDNLALIDFGVVREITDTYLYKQQKQETGTTVATPGYTPPEQMEGRSLPASDFFALGRTFIHLLAGEHPIHLRDPNTGEFSWRPRAPQVGARLAELLNRCIDISPAKRPQSAEEILRTLEFAAGDHRTFFQKSWTGKLSAIAVFFNDFGVRKFKQGQLQAAKFVYKLALFFYPEYAKANYNLGALYERQRKFKEARMRYTIAASGGSVKAYNNLSRLCIENRQYAPALNLLQEGLERVRDPKVSSVLHKNLGWVYFEKQQYDTAEIHLERAIALDGDRASAYGFLARICEASGDAERAEDCWQKFARCAEKDASPEIELCWKKAPRPIVERYRDRN